jgi:hypothetical protein
MGTNIDMGNTYNSGALYVTPNSNLVISYHKNGYTDKVILYTVINNELIEKAASTVSAITDLIGRNGNGAWISGTSGTAHTLVTTYIVNNVFYLYYNAYTINEIDWSITTGTAVKFSVGSYNGVVRIDYDSIQGKLLLSVPSIKDVNNLYIGTVSGTTCIFNKVASVTIPPCVHMAFDPNTGKFLYLATASGYTGYGFHVVISGNTTMISSVNNTSIYVQSTVLIRYSTQYSKLVIPYTPTTNLNTICNVDTFGTHPLYTNTRVVAPLEGTTFNSTCSVTDHGILIIYRHNTDVGTDVRYKLLSL